MCKVDIDYEVTKAKSPKVFDANRKLIEHEWIVRAKQKL